MNYYASSVDAKDPEAHLLAIYIGDEPPDSPEENGQEIEKFTNEVRLQSFLMSGDWDRVTIYKSPDCDQDTVDALTQWISINMGLNTVVQQEGG
jgi:hypothetical protein